MGYGKLKLYVHLGAFLIGAFSLSWMFVGLCAVAHHFMSPAIAASIQKADYDEMLEQEDLEGMARLARTVRILTLQGTAFSVLWYLVGLGLGSLF
jgi:hypothetical protein